MHKNIIRLLYSEYLENHNVGKIALNISDYYILREEILNRNAKIYEVCIPSIQDFICEQLVNENLFEKVGNGMYQKEV